MKISSLYLAPLLLLAACAGSRQQASLTSEPSIERALDLLDATPHGKPLLRFLADSGVALQYSNTAGRCSKFGLQARKIYVPVDYKGADHVLAAAVGRSAYIYQLFSESGMDEIISEEEELAALFQARLALELKLTNEHFAKAGGAPEVKAAFCNYILESSGYAMAQARKEALSSDPVCQRPLDTMENQRVWLEKMRQAINDETFYQLLYERDMARVRKGALQMSEAMRKDANLRALPTYEIYRYQRSFYDKQSDIFTRFARLYSGEIARDAAWRAGRREEIDLAREEFSDCNLP
ncbi:MAG: hypothetical protein A2X32_09290 [Elusimicrobia bacterium GWC2_64_44]|nr:MAG: hypothetical protein A2X32_09290 [Elusimicrobia bacterium GWC2_64_44]